jgi:uncharacterized protein YdhG (YjbR/CyaY superfamily)
MKKPVDIEAYINSFPADVQQKLRAVNDAVKAAAPEAEQTISYGMPLYKFNGRLVYFAAHTHHIGFYPMKTGVAAFENELSVYKGAEGSVQFPFDKPMPVELIGKIVQFRIAENLQKMLMKKK